ncbi:hypothetical protein DL96DRAFT_1592374 [Flagelloscypha sp. PMI_526]|nr:hypothetical protein DL96DRAFT_1592374 [Flagelloscypha sp. PMI_526]
MLFALPFLFSLILSTTANPVDMKKRQDTYPANFKPNFSSTKTLTLPYPIEKVFSVLGSDQSALCKVVLLSNIASDCELLEQDTVTVDGPLEKALVREQAAGPGFPRQHYKYKETIKIIPGISLFDVVVNLPGTNTWDEKNKVVLFETASDQGVAVVKVRTFTEINGGAATQVTETITGQCSWWLQSIVQKQVDATHKQVTDLYPTLFV